MLLSGKKSEKILFAINLLALCFCANCLQLLYSVPGWIVPVVLLFLAVNVLPLISGAKFPGLRLHICNHGVKCLFLFGLATVFTVVYQLVLLFTLIPHRLELWLLSVLQCVIALAVVFWNGMICVYATSVQLGLKTRILGIIFGLVPIANLVMLGIILKKTSEECRFELGRYRLDQSRKDQRICQTQYPILMVHGVFFRDTAFFNYWGRIPKALEDNGARVFYGGHESAASIENSALELSERIQTIVRKIGCEKVNIIAHSKGGLDCRYMIEHTPARAYVASLTTVNTPHRGCEFADYLLNVIPDPIQQKVANTYNSAMRKMGDDNPDFMAAVQNLTNEHCRAFDAATPVPEEIPCKCIGSTLKKASHGKFPMNFTYALAKYFDGPNDGLVGEGSFQFCEDYTLISVPRNPGVSHNDVIDMNRQNIPGFDVREFYVQLVAELKNKGL